MKYTPSPLFLVFGEISSTPFPITQGWAVLACYCISPGPDLVKRVAEVDTVPPTFNISDYSDTIGTQYRDRHTEIISTSSARRKNFLCEYYLNLLSMAL